MTHNNINSYSNTASPAPACSGDWPLRIYTLGRFAVVKDGIPLRFERKVQKRPLELLQALIALGGRNVSHIQLEDALWNNAAPKSAHKSFNMALHRLRKLVAPECLQLRDGKLNLNAEICWVDVWDFERRLHVVENYLHNRTNTPAELSELAFQVMTLLQGPFLACETEQLWMIPLRERLCHRVRRVFKELGPRLGRKGQCEMAIAAYLKVLEIDPLAEEFYRRLMICYTILGQHAEAIATYQRCCKLFRSCLAVMPSPSTEALVQTLQQQDHHSLSALCAACRNNA